MALQEKREARAAFEKALKEREERKRAEMIKSSKTLSEVVGGTGGGVLGSHHVAKGGSGDAQGWTSTSTKKTSSAVTRMAGSSTNPKTKPVVAAAAAGGGVQTELEVLRARRIKAEEQLAAAKVKAAAARGGKGRK